MEVPLFPLNTLLLPDGLLALRIFEARYLDMIRSCMRDDSPFGVVMIKAGKEVGGAAITYPVGTLATIANWDMQPGGLLHVDVAGVAKFRVTQTRVQADQLLIGEVETLEPEPELALPERYRYMATMLEDLLPKIHPLYRTRTMQLHDASWVGGRFTELLPLYPADKQALLELDDPHARLQVLDRSFVALQQQQQTEGDDAT